MPCFILHDMENLRITTVQSILHWEDVGSNLAMFDDRLSGLKGKTDLVILPEMFTTGFSMAAPAMAEEMGGKTCRWLAAKASELGSVVAGSIIIKEDGHYFNRLIWMQPDGAYRQYDKRHLFTMAKEQETFTAGQNKLIANWKGWKICPLVCYDLRFPVWSRNAAGGYDLLVYVANWPETRSHHWRQLLVARAIENQSFVAGVNRVGEDGKGFRYTGDTSVVDYAGRLIYQVSGAEDVFTCELSKKEMAAYREKLHFLPDQDKFEIL